MDEQLYLGTRLGSCLNNSGSKLKHRMQKFCSTGWSGQYHRMIRSAHRMVRWLLESITGQVSQEHVFLWLSWGSSAGWSDDHLRVSPDKLVRNMCFSDYLEDHAPDDPMVTWKNTTGWSGQARKTQQGDYWKLLCIGWSGGYLRKTTGRSGAQLRKPQEDPVVTWKPQEYPMVLNSWT